MVEFKKCLDIIINSVQGLDGNEQVLAALRLYEIELTAANNTEMANRLSGKMSEFLHGFGGLPGALRVLHALEKAIEKKLKA